MAPSPTLDLAIALMRKASVSPQDAGCQDIIGKRLNSAGFTLEACDFGDTRNLFAHKGQGSPHLVFSGHTDVVPPGEGWSTPAFEPVVQGGRLIGRGAADMKGALSAMVTASERFFISKPQFSGTLSFLITSDEEGDGLDGTRRVLEQLNARGIRFTHCLIGEATSRQQLGDEIKPGRRGSLHGNLCMKGMQGHVAYPTQACNAIHESTAILTRLSQLTWDEACDLFPASSLQITHINAGTQGVRNVIPGQLECQFNIRYSPKVSLTELKKSIESLLREGGLAFELSWQLSAEPFLSPPGRLRDSVSRSVQAIMGREPKVSTAGGTSDGRHFSAYQTEVVELGVNNATIHAANEQIQIEELEQLSLIYERILHDFFNKDDT